MILVREDPEPEPVEGGEGGGEPPAIEPLDFSRFFIPAGTVAQSFDGFSFFAGQLTEYPDDLQIYWTLEEGGIRYQDGYGDSALFTVTEDLIQIRPDEGGEIDYPRWLAVDDDFIYTIRDAGGVTSQTAFFAAGPYWSATVQINESRSQNFAGVLLTVQRSEDPEDGLVSMDISVYAPDIGRVASFVWSDCRADLEPRPDADFAGNCAADMYVDLLVTP